MRVLIYGGRDFVDEDCHWDWLDSTLAYYAEWYGETLTVVSGAAKGADLFGENWAKSCRFPVARYPADWGKYGKGAGHIRNQQMLDSGVDLAIEFPGGRGTADMRRRLDAAGVKVIEYDG